jgi:hypothetical protein
MAVRPRVEGRASVLEGAYLRDALRDIWIGQGTQRQIMALKEDSRAQASMSDEIHLDRKIYNPVIWPDGSDVA